MSPAGRGGQWVAYSFFVSGGESTVFCHDKSDLMPKTGKMDWKLERSLSSVALLQHCKFIGY